MADQHEDTQAVWHLLRLWLYDYYFADSFPYAEAGNYGFTARVFHALSHWKQWTTDNEAIPAAQLESRYKASVYDDKYFERTGARKVTLRFPPDAGEYKNHDYLLRRDVKGTWHTLCAVESEYGCEVKHLCEDLPKLMDVVSPLKVMIYRMPYLDKWSLDEMFDVRRKAIETHLARHASYQTAARSYETWLFVGMPWYRSWPKRESDTYVKLSVVSPAKKPLVLSEPDWKVWAPANEMDLWVRSVYSR